MPPAHAVHVAAPVAEKVPGKHAEQLFEPAAAAIVPAGHGRQAPAPAVLENEPGAQAAQDEAARLCHNQVTDFPSAAAFAPKGEIGSVKSGVVAASASEKSCRVHPVKEAMRLLLLPPPPMTERALTFVGAAS